MDAIRVNENTRVNQVSSRTQLVRSDSNLIDFFIGDKTMKTCSQCHQEKELNEFYKYSKTKGGLQSYCKACGIKFVKEYQRTKKGKETLKRYHKSEKSKANYRRYKQSEKGKATQKRYNTCHLNHLKSRNAVNNAIKDSKLPQLGTLQCYRCRAKAEHYHHPNYTKEDKLNVLPVCIKCHRKIHKKIA